MGVYLLTFSHKKSTRENRILIFLFDGGWVQRCRSFFECLSLCRTAGFVSWFALWLCGQYSRYCIGLKSKCQPNMTLIIVWWTWTKAKWDLQKKHTAFQCSLAADLRDCVKIIRWVGEWEWYLTSFLIPYSNTTSLKVFYHSQMTQNFMQIFYCHSTDFALNQIFSMG